MSRPTIYLVGDEEALLLRLKKLLEADKIYERCRINSVEQVLGRSVDHRVALVILASSFPDCLKVVHCIRQRHPNLPVILIPEKSSEAQAIAAFRAGATDYFMPPLHSDELVSRIRELVAHQAFQISDVDMRADNRDSGELIGGSPAMKSIVSYIEKVALNESNVLITGDTGTGKELVADLIHRNSARNHKPFVCLNCAAIPDTLLESELFGHERGAFTGAVTVQKGKFELAHGGTLFLDEIGEMGAMAQAKILRAIETKQIYRVGGQVGRRLDVRFIAATNQPLKQLMQSDKFRSDLFYRLNVTTIHLPPLRDRREDIPVLVDYFIQRLNERWGRDVIGVTPDALTALVGYAWPGNVRELKNVLERVFFEPGLHQIDYLGLPEEIRGTGIGANTAQGEVERIMTALNHTQWNKSRAAQQLQWSRMTLYRKLVKYKIQSIRDLPARPSCA